MGFLYIILAAVLFGSDPSVQKGLLLSGMSSEMIAFGVMAISCAISLAAGLLRGESFRVTGKQLGMLILAGTIGRGITEICLIIAYTMLPVGVATMVHFLFPTLVCGAGILFFHEKWFWYKGAAIVCSLLGLAGIAGGVSGGSLKGILAAGISSLSFAFYYLVTERSCIRTAEPMAIVFYVNLFAVLETSVLVTVRGAWEAPRDVRQAGLFFLSGLLCFLAFHLLNLGISMIGAGVAAFINMLEPVTSLMLTVALFRSRLTAAAVAGSALIAGAMLICAIGDSRVKTAKEARMYIKKRNN